MRKARGIYVPGISHQFVYLTYTVYVHVARFFFFFFGLLAPPTFGILYGLPNTRPTELLLIPGATTTISTEDPPRAPSIERA